MYLSEYILNDILSYDDRFFLKQNHQSYKDLFLQIEINNLFKIKNLINHYLKLCIFYSKYKYHGDDFSYYNTLIQNIEHLFLNNNIINNIKIYFLSISKEEKILLYFQLKLIINYRINISENLTILHDYFFKFLNNDNTILYEFIDIVYLQFLENQKNNYVENENINNIEFKYNLTDIDIINFDDSHIKYYFDNNLSYIIIYKDNYNYFYYNYNGLLLKEKLFVDNNIYKNVFTN